MDQKSLKKFEKTVKKYLAPLMTSGVMLGDIETANIETAFQAWLMLKYAKEEIGKRVEELRQELLKRAEKFGYETDKGGHALKIGDVKVIQEKRIDKLPNVKLMKELCVEYNLKHEQIFSKTMTVVLDASKIQNLVDLGKLPAPKVEAAKKVTVALRVNNTEALDAIYESVVGVPDNEEDPDEQEVKSPQRKRTRTKAVGARKGD